MLKTNIYIYIFKGDSKYYIIFHSLCNLLPRTTTYSFRDCLFAYTININEKTWFKTFGYGRRAPEEDIEIFVAYTVDFPMTSNFDENLW